MPAPYRCTPPLQHETRRMHFPTPLFSTLASSPLHTQQPERYAGRQRPTCTKRTRAHSLHARQQFPSQHCLQPRPQHTLIPFHSECWGSARRLSQPPPPPFMPWQICGTRAHRTTHTGQHMHTRVSAYDPGVSANSAVESRCPRSPLQSCGENLRCWRR
jgi:hypothetical protein